MKEEKLRILTFTPYEFVDVINGEKKYFKKGDVSEVEIEQPDKRTGLHGVIILRLKCETKMDSNHKRYEKTVEQAEAIVRKIT